MWLKKRLGAYYLSMKQLRITRLSNFKAFRNLIFTVLMKMENSLRSTRDGVVKSVLADPGASLEVDQPIVEFES